MLLPNQSPQLRNFKHEYSEITKNKYRFCTKKVFTDSPKWTQFWVLIHMHLKFLIGPYFQEQVAGDWFQCSLWRKLCRFWADQTIEHFACGSKKKKNVGFTQPVEENADPYANTNCCHQKIGRAQWKKKAGKIDWLGTQFEVNKQALLCPVSRKEM